MLRIHLPKVEKEGNQFQLNEACVGFLFILKVQIGSLKNPSRRVRNLKKINIT